MHRKTNRENSLPVNFELEIDDDVKHVENGNVGKVDTCAFDRHGVIYYVEFLEKHVPNHWFRPELLKKISLPKRKVE